MIPKGKFQRSKQTVHDWIDGRDPALQNAPDAHHSYASTPNLASVRQAAGITDADAEPLLKAQGYSLRVLHALEAGHAVPRIVVSRVTACLGLEHAVAKGELNEPI